jgi:hypothetical protein
MTPGESMPSYTGDLPPINLRDAAVSDELNGKGVVEADMSDCVAY